jgi:RNA polymerase sigma-70 factor (ECF subfamily)
VALPEKSKHAPSGRWDLCAGEKKFAQRKNKKAIKSFSFEPFLGKLALTVRKGMMSQLELTGIMMSQPNFSLDQANPVQEASWEELFGLYSHRLLKAAYLLVGNQDDARDLVQETFLQAIRSWSRFRGDSAPYSWLYGILIHVFHHSLRRKKTAVPIDELRDCDVERPAGFDREMDNRDCSGQIVTLLQGLSPAHREVLVLRYYEDLKIGQIADLMGVSRGTVKSRLHYATEYLQRKLPGEVNFLCRPGA